MKDQPPPTSSLLRSSHPCAPPTQVQSPKYNKSQRWRHVAWLFWLSTTLTAVAASSDFRLNYRPSVSRQRRTQFVTEDSDDRHLVRIAIAPFDLILSPTSAPIAPEVTFHSLMEQLLNTYLHSKHALFPSGTSLDYALIQDIQSNEYQSQRRLQQQRTVLKLGGALVSFVGGEAPAEAQVNLWVKEAMESGLPSALQNTQFYSITKVDYVSSIPAPTPEPTPAPTPEPTPEPTPAPQDTRSFGGIQEGTTASDDDSKAPIAASLTVVLCLSALVAVVLLRRRRQRQVQDKDYDDDLASEATVASRPTSPDALSSIHSEWTEDKSLKAMESESFERHPVHLRKDMLESSWANAASVYAHQDNRVGLLQPSHFSANDFKVEQAYEDQEEEEMYWKVNNPGNEPPSRPIRNITLLEVS